jgi:hypothetical protein
MIEKETDENGMTCRRREEYALKREMATNVRDGLVVMEA